MQEQVFMKNINSSDEFFDFMNLCTDPKHV